MASVEVGQGKLILNLIDVNDNKYSENIGYLNVNFADVSSTDTTVQTVLTDLANGVKAIKELTTSSLISVTATYDVDIDVFD